MQPAFKNHTQVSKPGAFWVVPSRFGNLFFSKSKVADSLLFLTCPAAEVVFGCSLSARVNEVYGDHIKSR